MDPYVDSYMENIRQVGLADKKYLQHFSVSV